MNYLVKILIAVSFLFSVSADEKNSIGLQLVHIKAGEFEMGSGKDSRYMTATHFPRCNTTSIMAQERNSFIAKITKDFFIGKNEVTVGQFKEFVKSTGYKTDAEKSSTGMIAFKPVKHKKNWNKNTWEHFFQPDKSKSWKSPGF